MSVGIDIDLIGVEERAVVAAAARAEHPLADQDGYGVKLLSLKGTVAGDIDLEF